MLTEAGTDGAMLATAEAVVEYGRSWARRLAGAGPLAVIVLVGELGAGKTTFAKGLAEGWNVAAAEEVTSPTYTLIHEYRRGERSFYHLDLYRIETAAQLETLGVEDLLQPPPAPERRLMAIEWGERVEAQLPRPYLRLEIAPDARERRRVTAAWVE